MKDHIECGPLERTVLHYLALNRDSLIQPMQKALKKDYKSVHGETKNLITKGYVETNKKVTSEKGASLPGYKLTREGLLYVFAHNNINYQTVMNKYGEGQEFFREYKKLDSFVKNKKLLNFLIQFASKTALGVEDKEQVFENPRMLLKTSFELAGEYSKLPQEEKDVAKSLADRVEKAIENDSDLKLIWEKRKKAFA
ncbi:hypothetical protein MUO79_06975 [Candidatus Bathyarchaeota archaeon]|nr:hypothetical protein [Candidatus Bathyarchaeota archaeon]